MAWAVSWLVRTMTWHRGCGSNETTRTVAPPPVRSYATATRSLAQAIGPMPDTIARRIGRMYVPNAWR